MHGLQLPRRWRSSLLVLMVSVIATIAAPVAAHARVPRGFVGMMVDGPLWPTTNPSVDLAKQLDRMVADGVQTIRVVFDWSAAQPYKNWSEVPSPEASQFVDVDGVPTRFGPLDQIVSLAAARRLTILPVVIYAPPWDAAPHSSTQYPSPARYGPYGKFIAALVKRYGRNGSFWAANHPKVPITMWEVWNEPNIKVFWNREPYVSTYVSLLRTAHAAIKAADPKAKVVLAGMPNYSWKRLSQIYQIHGARKLFDIVGVHPYTTKPDGVITIISKIRSVMDKAGDSRKPILADEVSWPSSQGKSHALFLIGTTEKGQAKRLAALLPMLGSDRRRLGLIGFDYYTWASQEMPGGNAFSFSGLWRFANGRFYAKPALSSFRKAVLKLEDCKQKGPIATQCLRTG